MQLLRRRPVVHPPEFDRAAPSALELDDHIQLLPGLRAEVVLRDLPATRDLALDHEIAALPVALDLDIPASIHYLSDLAQGLGWREGRDQGPLAGQRFRGRAQG